MEKPTKTGAPISLPRWSLVLVTGLHAMVLLGAAVWLPYRGLPVLSLLTLGLGLLHVCTLGLAAAKSARLVVAWRALSIASLLWLLVLTWSFLRSALFLSVVYGSLGKGIAIGLLAAWGLPVLLSVPVSSWGFAVLGLNLPRRRWWWLTLLSVVLVLLLLVEGAARAQTQRLGSPSDARAIVKQVFYPGGRLVLGARRRSRGKSWNVRPARCKKPLTESPATVFASYVVERRSKSACFQAVDLEQALARARRELKRATIRLPVKLDVVTALRRVTLGDPLLDPFLVRPGLDGVCLQHRCLMPWQLIAKGWLTEARLLQFVPDLRLGLAWKKVRAALAASTPSESAIVVEVQSLLLDRKRRELVGLHPVRREPNPNQLRVASRRAEEHVAAALQDNGLLRYWLKPFSNQTDTRQVSIPRQAGVTLVACEFARPKIAERIAKASLEYLARLRQERDGRVGLVHPEHELETRLGEVSLPLIAMLTCREFVKTEYDKLISELGRTLEALQTNRGDFLPKFDLATGRGVEGRPPMYAPGQAVYALVLLAQAAKAGTIAGLSELDLEARVQRSFDYYSRKYWDFPLSRYFMLEENWHCLAARAALRGQRHLGYERFCLDYVAFKSRFVLDAETTPQFMRGGLAIGHLIPPPNTPTAGHAEALAAAVELLRARGEDSSEERELLRRMLGFLLRQQFDTESCFACRGARAARGGFAASMIEPMLRIDYTQHAWAALGHGAHVLGLGPAPRGL